VFIQGDHYQFNAKNYAVDPAKETEGVRALTKESVAAGLLQDAAGFPALRLFR